MASTYNTEPPPTASVTLHTTAGPITFSLFAQQTPLASRNFLQHVLDGYYDNTSFHRVSPGFVVQGGDPSGTGEGGSSIYEDAEFEIDPTTGEKVVFKDEVHSRLKFNRRGLLGMAKMTDAAGKGSYGSQFFITLGDCRAELDGKCTMFGRVEGEGIYNIVKIAEAELVEGTERPMYPIRVTRAEVDELPKGASWQGMKKRERVAERTGQEDKTAPKKKPTKKKGGKTLLSFGGDEGEDEGPVVVKKAKFNTSLIDAGTAEINGHECKPEKSTKKATRRRQSASPSRSPPPKLPDHHRKPSMHDSTTQLPLKDPESPRSISSSPEPSTKANKSLLSETNAQIAALKASMRRDVAPIAEIRKPKSALEQMIPETSIRGRKRRHNGAPAATESKDSESLKFLNAFKARLDSVKAPSSPKPSSGSKTNGDSTTTTTTTTTTNNATLSTAAEKDDEEAHLCDLHFIANCQSCSGWDEDHDPASSKSKPTEEDDGDPKAWMSHILSFEKDRLGKDLSWKKKAEEELVVIDPREKERDIVSKQGGRGGGRKGGEKGRKDWDRGDRSGEKGGRR